MLLADVVAKAGLVLRDIGGVRHTQPELEGWAYAGQVVAAELRPDLFAEDVPVSLVLGTRQTAPAGTLAVLRVHGNCNAAGVVTGRTVTKITSDLMDQAYPAWRSETPAPEFRHWMPATRASAFNVYPPNDATGYALCELATIPDSTGELTLPAEYHMALVDYIVARALSKDSKDEVAGARAAGSMQLFTQALTSP